MTEERLHEIEQQTKDHPCYYLERELLTEIFELKTEIKVMDAMLEHYTTALTQLLKEAHTLWARKKQPKPTIDTANPAKEEEKSND